MNLDGPLDFENEDPLVNPPTSVEKRNKVIGLDDLLSDFYKEKSKRIDKENRKRKASKLYDSDDEEHGKEALLSIVDDCRNQACMNKIVGEEDIQEWGLCMFGDQKTPEPSLLPDLDNCYLLKEFMNSQLNSVVGLRPDNATVLLEGLLTNGWLTKLVEGAPVEIGWLPNYQALKEALESYGFRINTSQDVELAEADSESQGPPQNISAWLKFVAACCQIRCKNPLFTASQVEQIAEILVWLLLDRGLQGLSLLSQECLVSVIGSFKEKEWVSSCKKIANSLASRVPQDMNCLRIVESVSGVDTRSKHLRSSISNQMLVVLLDHKDSDEKLMSSLMSINLKEKSCNLFRTYIFLVLAENWLFSSKLVEEKPVLMEMWVVFLRNCSRQISSTDLRPYASKVRTKAAYLLQGWRMEKQLKF
ncbi:unnamed protein product [Thlaspi arvense]|uniref:Coiled-coil SMC6 And NSE5 INteracting (CANIN) domain-containing protein n=1 Tax=Thlaspi arvense TaxID=13288 RepID=A0AAU9S8S4_THLAR|nr:unnamed protein product [Thlaspi arvense]